jgi:hypothetical protein
VPKDCVVAEPIGLFEKAVVAEPVALIALNVPLAAQVGVALMVTGKSISLPNAAVVEYACILIVYVFEPVSLIHLK